MSTSIFTIYWDVQNESKYIGTPQKQKLQNDLDAHGIFLDLPRLSNESNVSYYQRLQQVFPLRAGAHQKGLVHGITRELGLQEKIGLKISPTYMGGKWLAKSPFVEVTATELVLYSDYLDAENYVLDKRINIFDHEEGYLLNDLIAEIQSSQYFVAELGPQMTGKEKSNGLIPAQSMELISREWVPANNRFSLEYQDIIPGSLFFSERDIFRNEVSNSLAATNSNGLSICWAVSDLIINEGEYFVDYDTGIVTTFTSASGIGYCRYISRVFPWYVRWSPIVVYSLRDENYRTKIFEEETMNDNSTQLGLVSAEGSYVYQEVFEKSPCLWGK